MFSCIKSNGHQGHTLGTPALYHLSQSGCYCAIYQDKVATYVSLGIYNFMI